MRNRYAGGCSWCSVWIYAEGGFLCGDSESGWKIECATCHWLSETFSSGVDPDEFDWELPEPTGCAKSVRIRVLGLTRPCWKCGKATVCVCGMYPDRPARGYCGLFTTEDDNAMSTAARLLRSAGRTQIEATIQQTRSKTARATVLAVCCTRCGAMQGNFMVGEKALALVAGGGVEALDTLAVANCPAADWQYIVHHPLHSVIAI